MAQESLGSEEVVLGEERGQARVITLNRPRQLNVINARVVYLLAEFFEKWEKDDDAKLVILKGAGRAYCAGGDLRMFYERKSGSVDGVYRMYWLCYHIHTYKKPMVAIAHGITIGGGASLLSPLKFSVVTEKTVFAVPEVSVGFHTDCSFSYILGRLPGHLGELMGLSGLRLFGKDIVAAGLATHFVPSEKLSALEKHLRSSNFGGEASVRAVIEEYSLDIKPDEESILNKFPTIHKCFSAESVERIIELFEAESMVEGNEWISPVLEGLKKASPTSLKITLKSIREGRKQTLEECLRKEFRLTMNLLRSVINNDLYEGIRALNIDKDNAPKWDPPILKEVSSEKIDLLFQPFDEEFELHVPSDAEHRWEGKFENSVYPSIAGKPFSNQNGTNSQ